MVNLYEKYNKIGTCSAKIIIIKVPNIGFVVLLISQTIHTIYIFIFIFDFFVNNINL